MPSRDLKNQGKVVRRDGFGVFSMSPAMVDGTHKIDYNHLQSQLSKNNAAKENSPIGLFNSYEYIQLSDQDHALTFEFARPFCQDQRGGRVAHRSGTFIKQCLVGQLRGYPSDYFGASCWNAHLKPENDYYLTDSANAEPAWLPQVSEDPQGGGISPDQIRAFLRDGRAEVLKGALWFLLQEYGKPISERRVLLIKDLPANVELWVAAIEHAFSAQMARQIPFSTNKFNLGNQTETALFHYTDSEGRFSAIRNAQQSIRKPYCMIVGYHPLDKFSESVRQLPTSNYVILDGTAKTLGCQPDDRVHAPYFEAAVQCDADMEDFCTVLLPSLPLKQITPDLPELFDAYKYLLDSNHKSDKWAYNDTLTHFRKLTAQGFPTNEALNQYLLEECLLAYPRFIDLDAGYPLLQLLWKLAGPLGRADDVRSCVLEPIAQALTDLTGHGSTLRSSWSKAESGGLMNMLRPALLKLFADEELPRYAQQFRSCGADVTAAVLEIYQAVMPSGADGILKNKSRFDFLVLAVAAMADSRKEVSALLSRFSRDPKLFHALVLAVAETLDAAIPGRSAQWWNIVTGISGGNVVDLCRGLADHPQTGIALVEKLLSDHILSVNHCSEAAVQVFTDAVRKLAADKDTGLAFFYAWIKAADEKDTPQIVAAARRMSLSADVNAKIFQKLDVCLPYTIYKPAYDKVVQSMEDWSRSMKMASKKITLVNLNKLLSQPGLKEQGLLMHLTDIRRLQFPIGDDFFQSELFENIAIGLNHFQNPKITVEFLSLFRFSNPKQLTAYITAYVEDSLQPLRRPERIGQMLYLTEVAILPSSALGLQVEKRVSVVKKHLESALRSVLPRFAKSGMEDQIRMMDQYPDTVREELIRMLNTDAPGSSPLGSIFNIFRK